MVWQTPNLSHSCNFYCSAYVHIQYGQCIKLDVKTCKCVFVGYGDLQRFKNYHLYDKNKWKYLVNLDVTKQFENDKINKMPLKIMIMRLKNYIIRSRSYQMYHNNNQ
jgi:hypothetical protein